MIFPDMSHMTPRERIQYHDGMARKYGDAAPHGRSENRRHTRNMARAHRAAARELRSQIYAGMTFTLIED